jgi:hypothetical protein
MAAWWKTLGYAGQKYCSRCSENLRDHLIRQISNSANCTRSSPCNECSRVLAHFNDPDTLWQRFDLHTQKRPQKFRVLASKTPKVHQPHISRQRYSMHERKAFASTPGGIHTRVSGVTTQVAVKALKQETNAVDTLQEAPPPAVLPRQDTSVGGPARPSDFKRVSSNLGSSSLESQRAAKCCKLGRDAGANEGLAGASLLRTGLLL